MYMMHVSGELVKLISHAIEVILLPRGLELEDHRMLIAQIIAACDENFMV